MNRADGGARAGNTDVSRCMDTSLAQRLQTGNGLEPELAALRTMYLYGKGPARRFSSASRLGAALPGLAKII